MTKFLNLDEIAAPEKSVKINGKDYAVLDMTVGNFIETTRVSAKNESATPETQFEEAVAMVNRYIPDIPKEELMKLNFEKLGVLIKFVNGELAKELNEAKTETETAKEGEAGKQ